MAAKKQRQGLSRNVSESDSLSTECEADLKAWRLAQLTVQLAGSGVFDIGSHFVPSAPSLGMCGGNGLALPQNHPGHPGWDRDFKSLLHRAQWILKQADELANESIGFSQLFLSGKCYSYAEISNVLSAHGVEKWGKSSVSNKINGILDGALEKCAEDVAQQIIVGCWLKTEDGGEVFLDDAMMEKKKAMVTKAKKKIKGVLVTSEWIALSYFKEVVWSFVKDECESLKVEECYAGAKNYFDEENRISDEADEVINPLLAEIEALEKNVSNLQKNDGSDSEIEKLEKEIDFLDFRRNSVAELINEKLDQLGPKFKTLSLYYEIVESAGKLGTSKVKGSGGKRKSSSVRAYHFFLHAHSLGLSESFDLKLG